MADRFIIVKLYHTNGYMTEADGYRGASCELAGVEPGKVYLSRMEAKQDAQRLSCYNYGFAIVEIGKPYPANLRDVYIDGVKRPIVGDE